MPKDAISALERKESTRRDHAQRDLGGSKTVYIWIVLAMIVTLSNSGKDRRISGAREHQPLIHVEMSELWLKSHENLP